MQYEFKSDDVYRFAREMMAGTKIRGDQMHFRECPYCHGGERKDRNSFAISLETGQFKCLRSSCGVRGNFFTLSRDFNFSLGDEFERYYSARNRYRKFKRPQKIKPKSEAVKYLEERGISEEIANRYEITSKDDNILVFPFFDDRSELRFIKYRKMDFEKGRDKNKEWCEPGCMPILFGMKQCEGHERLVITEGQIDSLSLAQAGIKNAVSVPTGALGFTWVPHVWDWFVRFKELVVFGDYENDHMTLLDELKKRFKGTVRAVQRDDYRGEKDANDILLKHGPEALVKAVEGAEMIPVKYTKRLADVESVDIYSIPRISTGIRELDRLTGGLYSGQLVLLSGKRGDGKSTFMSQIIAETLEQNKKVFVYSGELNDFYFKRWLDFQIAGPKNILKNETASGTSYTLTNSVIERINDWYRDNIFIYDNNVLDDDKDDDLLKTIETAVMQYGINLICIDNLMTALDVGMREDLNRAQSRFVGKLAKLARRYEVVIILVAHPRKNMNGTISTDDISGSADITNKVDVVMSYLRDDDLSADERILTVTKNRLTGKLTGKNEGIRLRYDQASKRIVGSHEKADKVYGWETDKEGFADAAAYDMIPFGEEELNE